MSFSEQISNHVQRLGICRASDLLGITPRAINQWRAGREPRETIKRGALAILSEAQAEQQKGGSKRA